MQQVVLRRRHSCQTAQNQQAVQPWSNQNPLLPRELFREKKIVLQSRKKLVAKTNLMMQLPVRSSSLLQLRSRQIEGKERDNFKIVKETPKINIDLYQKRRQVLRIKLPHVQMTIQGQHKIWSGRKQLDREIQIQRKIYLLMHNPQLKSPLLGRKHTT